LTDRSRVAPGRRFAPCPRSPLASRDRSDTSADATGMPRARRIHLNCVVSVCCLTWTDNLERTATDPSGVPAKPRTAVRFRPPPPGSWSGVVIDVTAAYQASRVFAGISRRPWAPDRALSRPASTGCAEHSLRLAGKVAQGVGEPPALVFPNRRWVIPICQARPADRSTKAATSCANRTGSSHRGV
jgi:hypothetical protein